MPTNYDVIVVGSGTAGQTAAYELKRSHLTIAVIETDDRPGGVCALSGCQAKKWFYEGTETVARSHHLKGLGITAPAKASWSDLRDAKNRFTQKVPKDTVEGLQQAGIDFIRGKARFTDPHTLTVDGQPLTARFIVLASGAKPMPLPFEGTQNLTTSSEFLELDRLPPQIVFVGGGFISFEFAHFAARIGSGKTRCTILEAAPRPLGPFDGEMVDLLVKATNAEGIDVHRGVDISAIRKTGDGFRVETVGGQSFEANLVVHGAGRSPNIEGLGLDQVGIERGQRGISVNPRMQTSQPHIYAIGDCAATIQLARVADAEALTASADIVHKHANRSPAAGMDYGSVPAVLFTYPQYAMVGTTEDALKDKGLDYTKSVAQNLTWPTYRRVGLTSAAYKVLVGDKGRILGAHILSDNATGLINTFALAMTNRIPVDALYHQSLMTPYPSRESDIIYMLRPLAT